MRKKTPSMISLKSIISRVSVMSPEKHILTANERPTTSVNRPVTGKSYNKRKIIDALDNLSEKELS